MEHWIFAKSPYYNQTLTKKSRSKIETEKTRTLRFRIDFLDRPGTDTCFHCRGSIQKTERGKGGTWTTKKLPPLIRYIVLNATLLAMWLFIIATIPCPVDNRGSIVASKEAQKVPHQRCETVAFENCHMVESRNGCLNTTAKIPRIFSCWFRLTEPQHWRRPNKYQKLGLWLYMDRTDTRCFLTVCNVTGSSGPFTIRGISPAIKPGIVLLISAVFYHTGWFRCIFYWTSLHTVLCNNESIYPGITIRGISIPVFNTRLLYRGSDGNFFIKAVIVYLWVSTGIIRHGSDSIKAIQHMQRSAFKCL